MMAIQPYAYFDESGKWQDRDFICLCGFLSDEQNWIRFVDDWSQLCRRHSLDGIHMTEFYHIARKKGWNDTKTLEVLQEFAAVIRGRILVGFAVGLDAKYYRAIPQEAKGVLGDPATACVQRLLRLIRNRLESEDYRGRISVTFDEEEGGVIGLYKAIVRLRKSDPDLGKYIGAVSFADDMFIIPLQAADMLANLTGRWFKDRIEGKATEDEMPEPLKNLVLWPNTSYGLDYEQELWDAEAIERALAKFLGQGTP